MAVSRLWILFLLLALIAYAACATGAAPCALARPAGLAASLVAAALALLAPERPRVEEAEREGPAASANGRRGATLAGPTVTPMLPARGRVRPWRRPPGSSSST